ncbi:MAG: flagellar hook-associated protein FlgK [Steroidobacteraceae bacterium]
MADMLNVAVSGLRAFQRALETTSHNIANSSTQGYSRQRVEMATQEPQLFGSSPVGSGVLVKNISRYSNDLLTSQLQRASSSYSRLSAYADKAGALNSLFANSSTGLAASLTRFSNALQGVANTPTSIAARQVLLSEAEGLTTRLQTYEQRLGDLESEVNQQLGLEASSITGIAANIAKLNQDIVSAQSQAGQAPSDLLDARDRQLADLASRLDTTVMRLDDGGINVFVGNGQPLVLGGTSATITAKADAFVPSRLTLAFQTTGGSVDIGNSLGGGSIGGLLDFRRELLDPARNQIGQIAVALTEVTNGQHREGMDLAGNMGGDLFAVGAVEALPALSNSGSVTVAATRTGAAALDPYDYVLRYNGSGWNMQRADTGAAVSFTGTGTGIDPIVAGGVSIVLSGTPASGDRFLVRPTAGAIRGMDVLISDPSSVAAAAPIRSAAAVTNTGTAAISAGEVLDAANAQPRSTVTLQFIDATHYSVNGVGSNLYTPGSDIDINGWRVQISGTPVTGDSFSVADNVGGKGDNRNALALASALSRGVLSGGTQSLNAAVTRFIGSVGVATSQANSSLDAQKVIYDDSLSAVDGVSGVNLDEEAANMLRFQQAYQAAAQMIRVTQTLFDSVLEATRR